MNTIHSTHLSPLQEWLAATFTKQIFGRRSAVEPPKFRSIVQAVRASMYVDKITRKPSQVTPVDVSPAQLMLQVIVFCNMQLAAHSHSVSHCRSNLSADNQYNYHSIGGVK